MSDRCDMCWNPLGEHNDGCPTQDETLLDEWSRGRSFGFADNNIRWFEQKYYSKAFVLGWRVGKSEIDALCDEAAQRNYSYHNDER